MQNLEGAQYVFGFIDDKTNMTEIQIFRKKFKAFCSLKNLLQS